jgi:hypothetical protein
MRQPLFGFDARHCSVEIDEWFLSPTEKQRLLEMLSGAKPRFLEIGRLQKLGAWLTSQGSISDF